MSGHRPTPVPPVIPGFAPVRALGSGGFADVFLYEQVMPSRRVAVKVMHLAAVGEGASERFGTEANLMARLSTHPSIATIYETGTTADGRPFLVMEYCPRGSLDERYRRERMTAGEVLRIGIQIAGAVETAHRAGIYHRDIKPANILVTEYGRAALTDFGISIGESSAHDGASVGLSVPWSAPEVLGGATGDSRAADVYSLGATLYSLLAGRSPFERPDGPNDARALTRRIASGPPVAIGRTDVPPALERTLAVAMATDSTQRFPTALEFARALQVLQIHLNEPVTPIDVADDPPPGEPAHGDDARTTLRPAVTISAAPGSPPGPGHTQQPPTSSARPPRPTVSLVKAPPTAPAPDMSDEPPDDTVRRPLPPPAPRPEGAAPAQRSPKAKRGLVLTAAVVGAVVLLGGGAAAGILTLRDSGAEAAPAPASTADADAAGQATPVSRGTSAATSAATPTPTPASVRRDATVYVLNGTDVKGVAAAGAALLTSDGFTAIETGDVTQTAPAESTVYYNNAGFRATAERIAGVLGVPTLVELATATDSVAVVLRDASAHAAPAEDNLKPAGEGDLGVGQPIANLDCTGEYVVLLGSTADPARYAPLVSSLLDSQPGARYLRTDASCGSFHQSLDGNPIYAVYHGPYPTREAACSALAASSAPVDAAVRALSADRTGRREFCSCLAAPEDLPRIGRGTASSTARARSVVDVQGMLYVAGINPRQAVDGVFGEQTEEWVRRFQAAQGLEPDGTVGTDTWRALQDEACR